jgi:hypothetical protein
MRMTTDKLREKIRASLNNQEQHEAWSQWLLARSQLLHHSVILPEGYRASTLINFTRSYLMRLPDMLEHAESTASTAELLTCSTLLEIMMDYLDTDTYSDECEGGMMYDWLVRAYVSHRVLEEMQDLAVSSCGENLIPLDNTRANLLAHELLGDAFCASLEDIIQSLCAVLHLEESHILQRRKKQHQQPPCMLANAMATLWLQEPAMA